jgi:peptide/nickel transport system ATP-binding protein
VSALLEIRALRIASAAATLVHDVSLTVEAGGATAIVGESGSGKTLSVLAVLRLLPAGLAAQGSIFVHGTEVHAITDAALPAWRATTFGVVPAAAGRALDPLRRLVDQAAIIRALSPPTNAALAEALALVGFAEPARMAQRYPHQLSGGEQQRAALALALLRDPDVLVIDEPTAALDAMSRSEVIALLRRIRAEHGTSILLVTHDLDVAAAVADHAVVVHDGRSVEHGAAASVWRTPHHAATRSLVAAWPRIPDVFPPTNTTRGAPILAVRHATVAYDGVPALHDVSLTIHTGERVALVGRTGSGKSTLVRALLGAPRREVQWVMQDAGRSLDPRLTVAHSLGEALRAHALRDEGRITRALEEVGLTAAHAARFPHQLSTGQQQRVAIARALIVDPHVLILDEPVSALDPVSATRIVDRLATIATARGLTTVFVTHDLARVPQIADRVVVMHEGRVVEDEPTVHVLTRPSHAITQALAEAQRRSTF